MESQNQQILNYLKDGNSLSPLEALRYFNCFRLSGRIKDLRNLGHDIKTVMEYNNGKRFARYLLKND